jgi:hypothetical protein
MRKSIVVLAFAVALGSFGGASQAAEIKDIPNMSESQLRSACGANGGSFNANRSGYSCEKPNGQGGVNGVYCDRGGGPCTGVTVRTMPGGRPLPTTVPEILAGASGDASGSTTRSPSQSNPSSPAKR